ncbi:MAG TPA: copper-binding protein [Burkholderiales bacterium]|nr:copper-binding protein [Burkholderiales bacterium]
MKKANRVSLAAVLVLFVATIPLSRAQGMGGMDMKDMDMSKCKDMMQGMDMSKCKDMMGKDKKGMEMKGMGADKKAEVQSHKGVGTVKKVDSAGGKVTIAHGPIPTMKWPAMNMTFTVKDKAMLGKFSQDKKVEFEFVDQGSNYVITSVK